MNANKLHPSDPAQGPTADIRGYGRELLAAVPSAAVMVFDLDFRVRVAEGDEFRRLGVDAASLEGRVLPDVLRAESWAQVRGPYERALAGVTSTFDFSSEGILYSLHVSPLVSGGEVAGALVLGRDVTEQRRLESVVSDQEALARSSERLLATAFDRAPIGICLVDVEGRWVRVNDAYCQMVGYERAELLEMSFRELTHPDDVAEDIEWRLHATAGESGSREREKRYLAKDGSIVWVHLRTEVIFDDEGQPAYTVSQVQNITERRRSDLALRASERQLRAIIDNIPGAVSVKGTDSRYRLVNQAFERRSGLGRESILGHRDEEILAAGALALDRETDELVLRTGQLAEREETVAHDGDDHIYVTVKFPLRDEQGQNYAVGAIVNDITYRRRRELELQDRLEWTERIHSAVSSDRLVLHAQPIINLATGAVEQAELLVRMLDVEGLPALVPPGEFLPAAERYDLVAVIDLWVVARAVELAKRGHRVEVNLSGKTISNARHVAEVERLVVESGAPPENIIFEITETAVAENLESARLFAERLRALGCSFALDDFGVGFGTFTYLKHLPVDYLKIDMQFVRDLVHNETDRQVAHAILGVARDFGIKTVAEGVEDQATLDLLTLMGVDYAQGYLVGRPGPIDELWPTTKARRTA